MRVQAEASRAEATGQNLRDRTGGIATTIRAQRDTRGWGKISSCRSSARGQSEAGATKAALEPGPQLGWHCLGQEEAQVSVAFPLPSGAVGRGAGLHHSWASSLCRLTRSQVPS